MMHSRCAQVQHSLGPVTPLRCVSFSSAFRRNAVPAVPVVSTARGERVAGGGIVAACAVQLGAVPASYAAVAANRRGSTPGMLYSNKSLAVEERKGRSRFQVSGGGKKVIVTGR